MAVSTSVRTPGTKTLRPVGSPGQLFAFRRDPTGFLLRMGSITEPVPARRVSAGFFRTLGVKPMLGRDFLNGEDHPGAKLTDGAVKEIRKIKQSRGRFYGAEELASKYGVCLGALANAANCRNWRHI